MMANDVDKYQDDWRLFDKLHICIRGPDDTLPEHHARSFQQIVDLGFYQFSTYEDDGIGLDSEVKEWRSAIKHRAQHLVEETTRLLGNQVSEMDWRLHVENIVFERFNRGIEW